MASISTNNCPSLSSEFSLKDRVESLITTTTNTTHTSPIPLHPHSISTLLDSRPGILPQVYEVDDPIYGKVSITSPCAIEIIHLPEFLRLKAVLQHGITALIGLLPSPLVNRFDHSLGAMILVKHLGGSEEAQLAALLHDVSHTALSHVTDLVFGYVIHEVEKDEYLKSTQIPQVLEKYGFDPQRVFNETLFPLLELPSPLICADRLDYALRDSFSFGFLNLRDAREIFQSIISIDGKMVIDSVRPASLLANAYLTCDQRVWANGTHSYLYKLAAKAIELSIIQGSITKQSLWTHSDQNFWSLLTRNASPEVMKIVDQINHRCQWFETIEPPPAGPTREITENSNPDLPHSRSCAIKLRVRTIDPPVNTPSGVQPLSILDPAFGQRRLEYIRSRESPITFVIKYSPLDHSVRLGTVDHHHQMVMTGV